MTTLTQVEKSDLANPDETFTTTRTYDILGRLRTTTDNDSNTIEHAYDSRGNVVKTTDALDNVTTFEYDGLSRLRFTNHTMTDTGTGREEGHP